MATGSSAHDPFAGPPIARVIPSSEAQREVWLADHLGEDASRAFNEAIELRIDGPLDAAQFSAAFSAVLNAHELLRATLSPDGETLLIAPATPVSIELTDLRGLSPQDRSARLELLRADAVNRRFELTTGPLWRASLLRTDEQSHILILALHHIVCDGWSFGVIVRDLLGACAEPGRNLLPGDDYAQYVQMLESDRPARARAQAFWLERLARLPEPLELPGDRARPSRRRFESGRVDHTIAPATLARLRAAAAGSGASLFACLLGGFCALLARISEQRDVVVGVPSAGQLLTGHSRLVGHCVNLLPLRVDVDPELPCEQLLRRVGAELIEAFEHAQLSYGGLLARLDIPRDPSRLPLVGVMFNLDQALDPAILEQGQLRASLDALPRAFENFELFVNAVPGPDGMRFECQYAASLFERETVQSWMQAYVSLLESMADDATRPISRLAIRADGLTTPFEYGSAQAQRSATLGELLFAPVRWSDDVALLGEPPVSHARLRGAANALAQRLREHGIGPGCRVGIALGRDPRLMVALLAVISSGAAYVPLDPAFPADRLHYMAQDAQIALLLSSSGFERIGDIPRIDLDGSIFDMPSSDLRAPVARPGPRDPAYLIYTSGSTGRPKGVEVPQAAVINFLQAMQDTPGIAVADRLLAVTTLSFDISVLELLLPMAAGAAIALASREDTMDAQALSELIERDRISIMQATPATWRMLVDSGWNAGAGLRALVGGESLAPDLARALCARCDQVWNMYGPTETTVWSTIWRVDPRTEPIRIGRPIANTRVLIVDPWDQRCGPGMPGELLIGGHGVASGYWRQPALTAERFTDKLAGSGGERFYRTGDRARWLADGTLVHMGRIDSQLKIRGFRIEPGEIETGLRRMPGVLDAAVVVREDRPGDQRLVAYLSGVPDEIPALPALRAGLRDQLPDYMLPQHALVLDSLPRLPNGKLDRRALPAPLAAGDREPGRGTLPSEPAAPLRDGIGRMVAQTMAEVLALPSMDPQAGFFAMGGHSLLGARLASRLGSLFELRVPMRVVFENQTAASLANWIREALAQRHASTARTAPAGGSMPTAGSNDSGPLSLMQRRLWFLESVNGASAVYNTPSAHRLVGPLDIARLERALNALIARQPILRTYIDNSDGRPLQRVLAQAAIELGSAQRIEGATAAAREQALAHRLDELSAEPIALDEAPLFRLSLFELGPREHVLFFMPHHIIWDGWSFDIFQREIATLYAAQGDPQHVVLPPLALSYLDFARAQQHWLGGEDAAAQLAWWREHLAMPPPPLRLAEDARRPATMSGAGIGRWLHVDAARTRALRHLGESRGATLFMVMLSLYGSLLAEIGGAADLLIGTPVRGREQTGHESLMGFFVNALALRVRVDPPIAFDTLLAQVRSETLDAFDHPDVPFDELVRALKPARDDSRGAICQAFFSYQDARERLSHWGDLEYSPVWIMQPGAADDIALWFLERDDGLRGAFIFNADIVDARQADRIARRFDALIDAVLADPAVALGALVQSTAAPLASAEIPGAQAHGRAPAVSLPSSRLDGAPQSETEKLLAEVWAELIGVSAIAPQDNFFDLGGHSLLVIEALAQMQSRTGKRVEPRRFVFETLAQIAHAYDQSGPWREPASRGGLFGRLFGRRQA